MIHSISNAIFNNPFLQTALIAGLLASFASGMMGSYVVIKRITSITGSIGHSILGGIGFFLWLKYNCKISWLDPIYGAFFAAILSAALIRWAHLRYQQKEGAIIAMVWSSGMAIGVIFVSLIHGYNADLSNFLFGNILLVTKKHLYFLASIDVVLLFLVIIFFQKFLAICIDEEQASLQGIPINILYFLLLCMIATSLVLLIQIMGLILVIALITIPSTIANFYVSKLPHMMIVSIIFCSIFTTLGTLSSYELDWPPGATCALIAGIFYVFCLFLQSKFIKNFWKRFRTRS